ncbi:hypothetical protein PTI98_000075 [Pleurotus ostreatus]|nr:hypothetical protein PTI98_000075 [Pleurotus ostreatus]
MKFARLLRVDHKLTSRLVHGPADFGLRVAHSACHEVGTSTEHGEYISTLKQDIHAHRLYFRSQVEAMDNLSLSTRTRAPTDINDIDLARPVAALAETISKAMSGLYALHVAIGRSGGEASSALVEFVECKQLIRNHWAALESFLQHSLGYARDYLGLCQSLQHENQAQYMVLASAILAHAQQIRGEIFRFQPAYTQMVKEFNAKEPAVKSRGSDKPVNGSSFDASISSFVVASHAALYPEIGKSFKAASAALCGSLVPIADISAFWDQHTYNLIALSRSEEELKRLTQNRSYFDMEITRWKAYRTALHDGVYSITSSSDAMMVTPMIQESNWRRRLGRFFPKRRTTNPVTGRSEIPAVEIGGPNAEYDSLKNPFNVLILSRTTYTINACLESFSQRFGTPLCTALEYMTAFIGLLNNTWPRYQIWRLSQTLPLNSVPLSKRVCKAVEEQRHPYTCATAHRCAAAKYLRYCRYTKTSVANCSKNLVGRCRDSMQTLHRRIQMIGTQISLFVLSGRSKIGSSWLASIRPWNDSFIY